MSQKLPKFSVVTVSYNQGEFIRDTIESVLNQNYPEFEHIVIDGGSTDNTIEVLKEYSHLNWVSEPDNGQTDALNKGFSKATGDIIAWINSDDWYAPNIFHTVAKHLESSFLTFGASEVVDRDGNTKAKIRNTERTWLDLMKYWCSYAIPAQPSVFFRRELLEEFKRPDGTYLDESLHYCMDFDFWLRITNKYRFDNRIKKVLSYYRMYEENKTGQGMSPLLPEMSKLFKKYESKYTGDQFPVYCIIPINECDKSVASTLRSIAEQSESTTAVALVGYNHSKQFASELELFSSEMQEKFPQLYIETHIEGSSYFEAVNLIAPHCQSPLLLVLEPGDFLEPNFIQEFIKIFQNDRVGFILPWGNRPVLKDLVLAGDESKRHFAIESLFKPLGLPFHFGVRKLAFTELEGFRSARSPLIALQEMIFRLSDHSWWVNVINTLNIKSKITLAERKASCEIFRNFINAHILVEIERDHEETPFAKVRFREGFSLRFPDALTKRSGGLLKAAPQDWHTLEFAETLDSLLETTAKYPHFSPGWYFLEQKYSDYGQIEMAKIAEAKYNFSKEHELKH